MSVAARGPTAIASAWGHGKASEKKHARKRSGGNSTRSRSRGGIFLGRSKDSTGLELGILWGSFVDLAGVGVRGRRVRSRIFAGGSWAQTGGSRRAAGDPIYWFACFAQMGSHPVLDAVDNLWRPDTANGPTLVDKLCSLRTSMNLRTPYMLWFRWSPPQHGGACGRLDEVRSLRGADHPFLFRAERMTFRGHATNPDNSAQTYSRIPDQSFSLLAWVTPTGPNRHFGLTGAVSSLRSGHFLSTFPLSRVFPEFSR